VWTCEFGKKWSWQNGKLNLAKYPTEHLVCISLHCKQPPPGHHPLDENLSVLTQLWMNLNRVNNIQFHLGNPFWCSCLLIGR
jgi:hypothetical protein